MTKITAESKGQLWDIVFIISTICFFVLLLHIWYVSQLRHYEIKKTCETNFWYDRILYNSYYSVYKNENPYNKNQWYKAIFDKNICYLFDDKNNEIIEQRTYDQVKIAIEHKEDIKKEEEKQKDLIDNLKKLWNQKLDY